MVHSHVNHAVDRKVEGVGRAHHLAVVDETEVRSGHGVVVGVVLLVNYYYAASPLSLLEERFDGGLSLGSRMNRDNSDKVILERESLRRQRSRGRILQQELLDSTAEVLEAEFNFILLVSRGHEDSEGIGANVMLGSPVGSDGLHSSLHIGGEVLLVGEEVVVLEQMLQALVLRVHMADSIVDSVLADVLSREAEAILEVNHVGDGVVGEVHLGQVVLLEVSGEPSVKMSLGHRQSSLLVEGLQALQHFEGEVLVADRHHGVGAALVDLLGEAHVLEVGVHLVGVAHIVHVHHVPGVPLPVPLLMGLRLSVSMESLIHHIVKVDLEVIVEAGLDHVVSTIPVAFNVVGGQLLHVLDNLGANQVRLPAVGEDAEVLSTEVANGVLKHF
mmetsp:Transcript_11767/g.18044  ORF Transcript_11767/g.18044 Transcript_11767/m.18044 type:complete len:387 (-) Transcript_11767:9-1169(-)